MILKITIRFSAQQATPSFISLSLQLMRYPIQMILYQPPPDGCQIRKTTIRLGGQQATSSPPHTFKRVLCCAVLRYLGGT